jgi:ribA/ribD-fused uncharacterized protein
MAEMEPHDIESLQRAVREGLRPKFVFFWGHTGKDTRTVGKECFSQWFGAPFRLDGRVFPTAEHYMMFQKAILFGDKDTAEQILAAPSPSAAKALGRAVRGFDEALWVERRLEIVATGNEAKFGQNPELGAFLRGTGRRVLVEASPTDRIWGIGLAEDDPHAEDPLSWRGLNVLGFALMIARSRLAGDAP